MGDTHQDDETGLAKDVNVAGQAGEMGEPSMAMVNKAPTGLKSCFRKISAEGVSNMRGNHQDDETGLAKDVNVVGQVGEMGQPDMAMVHELPPI